MSSEKAELERVENQFGHDEEETAPVYGGSNQEELPNYDHSDSNDELYPDDKKETTPLVVDGHTLGWNFLLSSNSVLSHDITGYVSQDSFLKYKTFKEVKPSDASYKTAIDLQKKGYAIPLIKCEHHRLGSRFMTIRMYKKPPTQLGRPFDETQDYFTYCTISRDRHTDYYKYEFKFTPDANDLSKSFTLWLFSHHRYPISDLTPYKGVRYRWVFGRVWEWKASYAYSLNILAKDQVSLADNLSPLTNTVAKSNPLLGNSWKNNLLPRSGKKDGFLGEEVAVLVDRKRRIGFAGPATLGIVQPQKIGLPAVSSEGESVDTLSEESLVFLCIASLFKRIEDTRERVTRAANRRFIL